MNEEHHRRLRAEQLAFFGRIGADVSHEMRNVLSVIGEYAGLLEDLLALAERGKPLDHARLKKLSAKLVGQVKKGAETMERFSRFAHAADEQTASFDLTALTGNMTALAQRYATLAGCRLEAGLPEHAVPVRSNPFTLQHAVFSATELVLESLEKGALATITLVTQGPEAVIRISGSAAGHGGDGAEWSGRISQLSAVVSALNGSVETSRADGALCLTLTIPIQ